MAACAARAVESWVDGSDGADAFLPLPEAQRAIARAIARAQCEQILFHGRRVLRGECQLGAVPGALQPLVARYVQSRCN